SVFTRLLSLCTDTPTSEIYTLSLHDALPICDSVAVYAVSRQCGQGKCARQRPTVLVWGFILIIKRSLKQSRKIVATLPDTVEKIDRKSTRLNSSHVKISYAVFCLKKKTSCEG